MNQSEVSALPVGCYRGELRTSDFPLQYFTRQGRALFQTKRRLQLTHSLL